MYLHIYIYDIYLPISLFKFIFIHIVLFHKRIQYITRFLKTFKTMVLQRCLPRKNDIAQESLGRLHMEGTITIPGFPKPAVECPTDILEREPEPPRLNLLVPRSDFYPMVPMVPQNLMQA